jgi:hypothetical protein
MPYDEVTRLLKDSDRFKLSPEARARIEATLHQESKRFTPSGGKKHMYEGFAASAAALIVFGSLVGYVYHENHLGSASHTAAATHAHETDTKSVKPDQVFKDPQNNPAGTMDVYNGPDKVKTVTSGLKLIVPHYPGYRIENYQALTNGLGQTNSVEIDLVPNDFQDGATTLKRPNFSVTEYPGRSAPNGTVYDSPSNIRHVKYHGVDVTVIFTKNRLGTHGYLFNHDGIGFDVRSEIDAPYLSKIDPWPKDPAWKVVDSILNGKPQAFSDINSPQ